MTRGGPRLVKAKPGVYQKAGAAVTTGPVIGSRPTPGSIRGREREHAPAARETRTRSTDFRHFLGGAPLGGVFALTGLRHQVPDYSHRNERGKHRDNPNEGAGGKAATHAEQRDQTA